jgi:hypothetical protein
LEAELEGVAGCRVMTLTIATDGARLTLEADIKPEITNGGMRGARGLFARDQRGAGGGRRPRRPPVQPGPDGLTVKPRS